MPVSRLHRFCEVNGLTYNFKKKLGVLKMAPLNCCDMRGCIDLFKKIDRKVRRIETFAGDEPVRSTSFGKASGWRSILRGGEGPSDELLFKLYGTWGKTSR